MNTPEIEDLRQLIESTLAELEMSDALWSCIKATSLDHTPESDKGVLVVWLTDRNVLAFHDENGSLLKTVSLDEEDASSKAA
jgi:hypothetical protein